MAMQQGGKNPACGAAAGREARPKIAGGEHRLGQAMGGGMGGSSQGGGLGGLLAGAGGLGALVEQFTRAGHGNTIDSWIGSGQNQPIAPHDLGAALGPETVGQLLQQTGMGSGDLLAQLSRMLPGVIDGLTPQGRMPTSEEHAHW